MNRPLVERETGEKKKRKDTRYKKKLTLDWKRILSFVSTAERNIKSI